MDDLSSKISSILSDPQALEQIKSLGGMLGLSSDSPSKSADKPSDKTDSKASDGLLSALTAGAPDMNTIGMITRLMPIISDIGKEDDTTRLLNSLRPFLSDERKLKLDSAIKLIRIMKLLPLVKDMGLLESIF